MQGQLSVPERKKLLKIAREAIVCHVNGSPPMELSLADGNLSAAHGCFVTIKRDGALRGCLGQLTSDRPLCLLVQEMAAAAATRDPRFYPMKREDLDDFRLEISVLSPMKKIASTEEIETGVHGIYIEKNFYRGVLLPQVAVEYGWDRETFLAQTCLKAGLDRDAWKEEADIFIFSAQVFGED